MIFKENMTFKINDTLYRLIGCDEENNNIFIIEITDKIVWNEVIDRDTLGQYFFDKVAVEVSEPKNQTLKRVEYTNKMIEKQMQYYEIIQFLLQKNNKNDIFYKKTRKKIIDEVKDKFNISESKLKRIFNKYLKNGKVLSSLYPDFHNCGGKGKSRDIVRFKNDDIVNVDYKFRKIFEEGINKYYKSSKKNSIITTYELTMRDYISKNPNDKIPNLKQFYYWFNKINKENRKNIISKRYGDRIYNQTSRPIVGNSLSDTLSPADLYQVDSTILDIYLVSKLNRNLIVGRPVLYLVIDTYSRMIVGINVTLEPFNSYSGVQMALVNAFTNKVDYCKQYGVEISSDEWNTNCICNRILADRGELLSSKVENGISNLGIMLQNTPPYRGDMKGIVEKAFERIHALIKPFCEGVVDNKFNVIERGNEDYRLKANLTLEEITTIIIKCVLFHNNHKVMDYYQSDGIDIANNIPKIPRELWNYGIQTKKGLLRILPEDTVRINLMPTREATVTSKGVRFNKLYYVSTYTLENGYYQKARIEGNYKIKISYNQNNTSEIFYIKEDGMYDVLRLVDYMSHYKHLSEEELNKVFTEVNMLNEKIKEDELKAKFKLYNDIESITENARKEMEIIKDKSLSKSHRLKNIRNNLDMERKYYRDKEINQIVTEDDELQLFENTVDDWEYDYE